MWLAHLTRSKRHWLGLLASLALLLTLLAPEGCALFAPPQASISGRVYGVPFLKSPIRGTARPLQPLKATVRCNKSQVTAAPTGVYALTVDKASQYVCVVSGSEYIPVTVTLSGSVGAALSLNFGSSSPAASLPCAGTVTTAAITCAPLQLRPATLHGTITSADTQQPLPSAIVSCSQPVESGDASQATPSVLTASTNADGAFTLRNVTPGVYACHVGADPTLYQGSVNPGGSADLTMHVCSLRCPAVTYHSGAVMHDMTAYVIFWLPKGSSFEQSGSSARFESLVTQYFNDVGGTPFLGLLSQYWDYAGNVDNSVTLGAISLDTTRYPHTGNRADPLSGDSIEREIDLDAAHNHWTIDGEHAVFLFTGYNIESCVYSSSGKQCSFGGGRHYCAYHSDFRSSNGLGDVIYGYIPVLADCAHLDELATNGSPNHDSIADATINSLSHEQVESITDPYGSGWYDAKPEDGEIGDKCAYDFGAIRSDGSNVTLAHGHSYLLQKEWSDRINGCALQ